MITTYNPTVLGDVVMLTFTATPTTKKVTMHDRVTVIRDAKTDNIAAINIFNIADELTLVTGQNYLNVDDVTVLNDILLQAGVSCELTPNPSRLVIGYVESMTPHPDSDHLNVTKTCVGPDQYLQIVSGSPNMAPDNYVVVAQPGTMMPSGALIWDGALRGVPSAGMIVSGRELHLAGAPDQPGALLLPVDFGHVGEPFDFEKGQQLFQ